MGFVAGTIRRAKFRWDRLTKLTAYRHQCRNPLAVQTEFLQQLLRRHQETEFGKRYDFKSIRSVADFQARVPVHTWDKTAPYVKKVEQGDRTVLFPPEEKVLMFAATSGTTGEPKYIPVTETSYRLYGLYWDHFWGSASRYVPECADHKALYFPGDPEEGHFGTIPYGAITSKAYAQQNFLLRAMYPYPYQVCRVKDYPVRYYTIMRMALETKIGVIPIPNPSTILTLFKIARERSDEMIDDVRQGRLRYPNQMPAEVRTLLQRQVRPNPERAAQLERIRQETRDFLPRDYWPGKIAICCFASGPLRLYLRQFSHYLDDYSVTDFGLLASEGRLSFGLGPISRYEGCCPTLESNFFEFIPEHQIERSHPDILTLDQLEKMKRYYIIFTNYSGLYRYNINDCIQVTGFYEKTPMFTFCHKGKHMSNIAGEKLTEYQVTESVHKAGEKIGYRLHDFVVCLHWDEQFPCYYLIKDGDRNDRPEKLQKFITTVDEELMKMNHEYRSKRKSLRLGPLILKSVTANGYRKYENNKQKQAHNLSQYKQTFLVGDPKFEHRFKFKTEIPSTLYPARISPKTSHKNLFP